MLHKGRQQGHSCKLQEGHWTKSGKLKLKQWPIHFLDALGLSQPQLLHLLNGCDDTMAIAGGGLE